MESNTKLALHLKNQASYWSFKEMERKEEATSDSAE
jgi:hypothetical protein